jgi:integrase
MYRKSAKYGAGIYQRCTKKCPDDRCRIHKWTFAVEFTPDSNGKRPQITRSGFETAKAAADARDEVVRKHRAGELADDRKTTLGEWLSPWLEGKIERKELAGSTARTYRDQVSAYFIPKVGHVKLAELRGAHLTQMYGEIVREREALIAAAQQTNAQSASHADLENERRRAAGRRRLAKPKRVPVPRPLSPATIKRMHAVVSGALKSAVKAGRIPRNVAADAELPRQRRRKVRPPSPEEYGGMLDSIEGDRLYSFVLMAGHSGLRRGELAALRWSDIDLKTGRIVVRFQRTTVGYVVVEKEVKTEAGDERIVHIDKGTIKELKAWQTQQGIERTKAGAAYHHSEYVFTRPDGLPYHPGYLTKVYKKLATRAGLGTTKLHGTRHFRAAALISTGADMGAVSKEMGHTTISVTSDIYGHLFDKASKDMAAKAAKLVTRRRKPAKKTRTKTADRPKPEGRRKAA